jgi:hypothetical protein
MCSEVPQGLARDPTGRETVVYRPAELIMLIAWTFGSPTTLGHRRAYRWLVGAGRRGENASAGPGHPGRRIVSMNSYAWLSPLVALLGVLLGGFLSARSQTRTWKLEETRRWRESRLAAHSDFVAAVREFRTYVLRPDVRIGAVALADGVRIAPSLEGEGTTKYQMVEAMLARVKMIVRDQATLDAALLHLRVARRFAAARAVYGLDKIPPDIDVRLFTTEIGFLNAARTELGLPDVASLVYHEEIAEPSGQELRSIDRMLWNAYHGGRSPNSC